MLIAFYILAAGLILFGLFGAANHFDKKKKDEASASKENPHPTNPNLKYCRHCNNEVAVTAITCPKCGGNVSNNSNENFQTEIIISFLIPLVGLILYAVNSNNNPVKAKKVLTAAGWGFAFGIIIWVLISNKI